MLKILEKIPNESLTILDDTEAKMLLFELGLITRFTPKPSNVPKGRPSAQVVRYTEHTTHFILALLILGYPKEELNGYGIVCFPKSQMPLARFNEFAERCLKLLKPVKAGLVAVQGFFGQAQDN